MNKLHAITAFLLFTAVFVRGDVYEWTGAAIGDNWNDSGSWNNITSAPTVINGFPGYDAGASAFSEDTAIFRSDGITVTLPGAFNIGAVHIEFVSGVSSINLTGTGVTININNLQGLTVGDGGTPWITITGTLEFSGAFTTTVSATNLAIDVTSGNFILSGAGAEIASDGPISITATPTGNITINGAVTGATGVTIDSGGTLGVSAGISSTNAPIALTADYMTVGEAASPVDAGTGTVTIQGKNGNETIALNSGSADISIGTHITAGTLAIGSTSASGDITVSGDYALIPTIILKTGAGISDAGKLTVTTLVIDAIGAVNLSGASHVVDTLQVTNSGGFQFKNDDALVISGITSSGAVDVEAAGPITISGPVKSGGAVDVEAAGDITISGLVTSGGAVDLEATAIAINGAVTAATGYTVALTTTTGGIIGSGAITGTDLTIDATNAVDLSGAPHAVNTLQATTGGEFRFANSGALGISGITGGGAVDVEAAGDITINGAVTGDGAVVVEATGNIAISGAVTGAAGVTVDSGGTLGVSAGISSTSAPITLIANSMTVGEAASPVNAGTGTVTIKDKTGNKTIALNGGSANITIGTNITAGTLDIGSKSAPASGDITVSGNYAAIPTIKLKTGAGISDAGTLTAATLVIDAIGAVNLSGASHAVNTLQVMNSGGFRFKNNGALGITEIASNAAVDVEAVGPITMSAPVTISGAFTVRGTLLAIGNDGPGGAQTVVTASSMVFDTPRVTGNITFDGDLAFARNVVELTGHIFNNKTISAGPGQKLYFNGDYTGISGSILEGTDGTTEIHLAKNAEFAASGYADNGSWLVFSGTETQQFNSGGTVLGNVRIHKGGGELHLVGSDVIQRGNAALTIVEGLLNLAYGTGPGGTVRMGWTMGVPGSAGQAHGGNFFGIDGTLTIANDSGAGAELRAMDIVLRENAAFIADGAGNNTMAAMGNIAITKSAAGNKNFGNSALVMIPGSGAGRTEIVSDAELFALVVLRPARISGNITVTEMQIGSPAYTSGISLDGGSSVIRVLGNWTNHVVDTDSDGVTQAFVYGISEVIFDRNSNPDKVIVISGGSAWHTFTCESPGATVRFDNYPSRHYVAHRLNVKGTADADSFIVLTRLLDAGQPDHKPPDISQPLLPLTEEDHKKYWDIVLQPSADGLGGTTMDMENSIITYSNSNLRSPLPSRDKNVLALPFYNKDNPSPPAAYPGSDYGSYSYYNINWIIRYSFIYAFTEDANGNGRIDRIRAQAAYELNSGENGAFDKISIRVTKNETPEEEWIKVKGYGMTPGHPDSIYIYLEEHDYADGGARDIAVHIEANESLMDLSTGLNPVTNPENGPLLTTDTVFPRITYAVMPPSSNKAFVQFSEDIDDTFLEFAYPDNQKPDTVDPVDPEHKHEFELGFAGTGYGAGVLASGPLFAVAGARDSAVCAWDKNADNPDFPSPKYPVDWTYSDYVTVPGNPPEAGLGLIPPNALPGTILSHRVTDLLVSDYPGDYFALPVWAMNTQENLGADQGVHAVRVFNGSDYLEDRDIVLEVNVNPELDGYIPEFIFSAAIPEAYRAGSSPVDPDFGVDHGIAGLWLPPFASLGYDAGAAPPENIYAFSNIVARPWQSAYFIARSGEPARGNFSFKLEKNSVAYSYAAESTLEFFLRLIPSVANPASDYLYLGRLGKGSPWYRHIEPFKFQIHNITRQRGGVTILNNVIKPSTGEQVYVNYTLNRSGPVTVQVFTLDGNLVKILSREHKTAGEYRVSWDGRNNGGREVARGMYFIRVVAPDIDEIRKVMVIK